MYPLPSKGGKSLYLGESHRTIFDRMSEHFGKLNNCQKDSSLTKHWKNFHPDMKKPPKFTVKVESTHLSATERQVAEAIAIEDSQYDNLLNSKAEWGLNSIPRQRTVVDSDIIISGQNGPKVNSQKEEGQIMNAPKVAITNSSFETQYSQRKRMLRLDNKEKREKEKELVAEAKNTLFRHAKEMKKGIKRLAEDQNSILDAKRARENVNTMMVPSKNSSCDGSQGQMSKLIQNDQANFQQNPT